MKTLIIGGGEIGKSLYSVLTKEYSVYMYDIKMCDDDFAVKDIEIIHICFPYSKKFIKYVKNYKNKFKPKYTVIHSTVPIGTSFKLNAIHSPVVGVHPNLEESIQTFTKFLGGKDASFVADYFRRANIKIYLTDKSETTELMKLLSTTYYGMCIEYTKNVKELCDKNKIPFEMWTLWNENYNLGYKKLGHPEYTRPNLIPLMKKIGGHCILENLPLLKSKFSNVIEKLNKNEH